MERSKLGRSLFFSNSYNLDLQKQHSMDGKKDRYIHHGGGASHTKQLLRGHGDKLSNSKQNEIHWPYTQSERKNKSKLQFKGKKTQHQLQSSGVFDSSSKKSTMLNKNSYSTVVIDLHRDWNSSVSSSQSDSYQSGNDSLKSDNEIAGENKGKGNLQSRFPKLHVSRKGKTYELKPESFRKPLLKREKDPNKGTANNKKPVLITKNLSDTQITIPFTTTDKNPKIYVDERRLSFQETKSLNSLNDSRGPDISTHHSHIHALEARDTDTPSLAYATPRVYAVFPKSPRLAGDQYLKIRFPQDLDKLREMRKPISSPIFTSSTCSTPDSEFDFFVR